MEIEARRIENDGTKFGVATDKLYIEKYTGLKKITDLDVYPLSLAPNADEIREDALERGRKYSSLRGILHREYKGLVFEAGQHNVRQPLPAQTPTSNMSHSMKAA